MTAEDFRRRYRIAVYGIHEGKEIVLSEYETRTTRNLVIAIEALGAFATSTIESGTEKITPTRWEIRDPDHVIAEKPKDFQQLIFKWKEKHGR